MSSRESSYRLNVEGAVERRLELDPADLAALDAADQVPDVSRLDPQRKGDAVRLSAVLRRAGVLADARYLTVHATRDEFHASVPLAAVRDRALLIYRLEGGPLPLASGGPVRLFIPDLAACQSAEVNQCANVKFVDRIELSIDRGLDTRPTDETSHAALHQEPKAS